MHPVEKYLHDIQQIHRTGGGTKEESYYGALETLLNEIGAKLKPKVRCVAQLRNTGGGEPDFGLYTASQFQTRRDDRPLGGQPPERGVIEVKDWSADTFKIARDGQVAKYLQRYGLVLVTNYREFVLVGGDSHGNAVDLEPCTLAPTGNDFLELAAHPRKAAAEHGERLTDFLRRVMLHRAPVNAPEDLAWFLASYAREARARVEAAKALPALDALRKGIEEALGMSFEGEKGDHFFRATLVQTLFYGVFSSWVLWARNHPKPEERFDWRNAAWTLHVPMIKSLFDQIATPSRLKALGVDQVLDWAGNVLNRVDRALFFQKFQEEHAVQYFYEPFLKAYDPELRKELGVWYTPPEIVAYQVERVDRVLREELGIADGLADEQVVVLDPCCGTGAYLVETLKRIHATLEEQGASALTAQKLKRAAMTRVFGFEILPAPFVVAHLQIGLMLRLLGAPLSHDGDDRAGVYLTNALTGWEPLKDPKNQLPLFPELAEERDAANDVKQRARILVILGNPPYNAFAGTSPDEEGGLVDAYKEGLTTSTKDGGWGIKKFNLDDLYVRFFRIAERRIAKTGKGVVCYISNYSWTSEPSFVVLRKRLLQSFDKFWIENMHGNRKISEYAPDGRTSETVFAIPGFSAGIQQGVVISLWVRRDNHGDDGTEQATVLYRDDIDAARAVERREQLLDSLRLKNLDRKYETAAPAPENRYSFRPSKLKGDYAQWPSVVELPSEPPSNGLMEKRGGALMDIDREALAKRMKDYFNPSLAWDSSDIKNSPLSRDAARYDAKACRHKVLRTENYDSTRVRPYALRPFDNRWCYYSPVRPLWNEPRPSYWAQCWEGNAFFMTRPAAAAEPEGCPFYLAEILGDNDFQRGHAYYFPIRLRQEVEAPRSSDLQVEMFGHHTTEPAITANLSKEARAYLGGLGIDNPDADAGTAGLIWMHALAIGYSPAYLEENADGIRQDWPRIPLPATRAALEASAALGRQVAALLDTETPVDGVTCGRIRPALRALGAVARVGGGALNPDAGDLDLTAGWGHAGARGVCMPGRGKAAERALKPEEKTDAQALAALYGGPDGKTLDVFLNDGAYWANVPPAVWDYTIGGYQVIKKWLSYREKGFLGRGLTLDEAEYVTGMVRRIAALVLLRDALDANYRAVTADGYAWPRPGQADPAGR